MITLGEYEDILLECIHYVFESVKESEPGFYSKNGVYNLFVASLVRKAKNEFPNMSMNEFDVYLYNVGIVAVVHALYEYEGDEMRERVVSILSSDDLLNEMAKNIEYELRRAFEMQNQLGRIMMIAERV